MAILPLSPNTPGNAGSSRHDHTEAAQTVDMGRRHFNAQRTTPDIKS
jgi:hypothetical protein